MQRASRHPQFMKTFAFGAALIWFGAFNLLAAGDNSADKLAQEVWAASGGENLRNVKAIDFTFAVEKEGKTSLRGPIA